MKTHHKNNERLVTKVLDSAQKRIEERNYEQRKNLFEYDDVLNQQREIIYELRNKALLSDSIKSSINEFIDDLKLRLGWGRTGQQNISGVVGFYPTSPLFIVGDQNSQYLPGVNLYSAAPFQTGLTWEKTSTFNAGLDFAFSQKRILTGFFDVFKRETTDLLTRVNLPPGQALTDNFIANRGTTESEGFELGLNLNPINSSTIAKIKEPLENEGLMSGLSEDERQELDSVIGLVTNPKKIDNDLILKFAPKIVEGVDKLKKWSESI